MKKLLLVLIAILAASCLLVSCGQGEKGEQGDKGDKGEQGIQGLQGLKGDKGENGEDGRGVEGFEIINGELVIYYTDGTSQNLGKITNEENKENEGTIGLEYYQLDDGNFAVGVGTAKLVSEVVIPATYNGKTVTRIVDNGFSDAKALKKITIPKTITSMGDCAFANCDFDSVNYLGEIKDWCNIEFKGSCPSPTWCTDEFYIKGKLVADLVIPSTVTIIKEHAFDGYKGLTSVTIPNSVKSIEYQAFYNCNNLTSVTQGNNVESIGESAFFGCNSLTVIEIPDSVTSIGWRAFSGCTALTEIKFNATAMDDLSGGNYVFHNAGKNGDGIKVTIGKDVTKIPAYLFCPYSNNSTYSPKITSVVFEEGSACQIIGSDAFRNCTTLLGITMPNSIASIGASAFSDCSSLISVNYFGSETDWCNISFKNAFSNPLNNGASLHLKGAIAKKFVIPDTVKQINDYAFYGCTSLEEVIMSSVEMVGYYAFYNCTSLEKITIPESVMSIKGSAFYGCTNLTEINFNAVAMNDFGENNYVFYNAGKNGDGIKVTIGKNVTKIPAYLFYTYSPYYSSYLPKITSVVIEEGSVCEKIEETFSRCTALKEITIPSSVTSIGVSAFSSCSSLESVNYLGTIEGWFNISFGNYYANPLFYANNFYLNGNLVTNLIVPSTVTEIEDYAFYYCTSLTSLTIPDSVTSIGNCAFSGCYSLTSVTIGEGVKSIGDHAFFNCRSLKSIKIPESVTIIEYAAFMDCDSLTSATFENANGWYVTNTEGATSGTNVDLTNASTNVTYLKDTYRHYYWYKK